MDISKLVVGQVVLMQSGNERRTATVSEIGEGYVDVTYTHVYENRPLPEWGIAPYATEQICLIRFNYNNDQLYNFEGEGYDPRPVCTKNGGPWRLAETMQQQIDKMQRLIDAAKQKLATRTK